MRFLRYFGVGLVALAAFCSVMIVRQLSLNEMRHSELLESLIILQTKGYPEEANRLYQRLVLSLPNRPDSSLVDDLQRIAMVIDPTQKNSEDMIWRYYSSLTNEINRRGERNLARALDLAK